MNWIHESSAYSTIGGGQGNLIQTNALYATIPGGVAASASHYGQWVYASGQFEHSGDAQASLFVLRRTTTSSTLSELYLDGRSARLIVPRDTTWTFKKSCMNTRLIRFELRFALAVSVLLVVTGLWAQSFGLDWSSFDAGGGRSAGGRFVLAGTIGQPDAGLMTGGPFTLSGGFGGGLVIQPTTEVPRLVVRLGTSRNLVLSWPTSAADWTLQQNADLTTTNWTSVAASPVATNDVEFLILPAPMSTRFYRLYHP